MIFFTDFDYMAQPTGWLRPHHASFSQLPPPMPFLGQLPQQTQLLPSRFNVTSVPRLTFPVPPPNYPRPFQPPDLEHTQNVYPGKTKNS